MIILNNFLICNKKNIFFLYFLDKMFISEEFRDTQIKITEQEYSIANIQKISSLAICNYLYLIFE